MTSYPPIPKRRWKIAWLLGLGVLVNYFDRVNLSVSQAALHAEFGISPVTFGYLAGAYSWTYALCQLPIGVILDKFGIRLVGRISTLLWTIASFAAAISPWLGGLFAARLLLGIGEAPTFPANAKAIGRWFPREERSLATAIFDSAAKFGPAIGVPLIGALLIKVGWRWSFAATGLISFLYFLLFSLIYRDPQEDVSLSPTERAYIEESTTDPNLALPVKNEPSLGALLRHRKVLGLAIGFGSYNYVFYLLLTWLPSYLNTSLHMDLQHSFLYTGLPWIVATCTDLFIGGMLADTLIQRGWNAGLVRKVILVTGTACGIGILGAAQAHTSTEAILWITLSIGGLSAAAPIGWSIPGLIIPRGSVGRVGGIVNFSNQLSGVAAPIITGYLVQSLHSFNWAFAVAAIYLAFGIAAYLTMLGKIEPIVI